MIDDVQFQLGDFFALLRRLFHPVAVGLGIGDLRGGEEGGQHDEHGNQQAQKGDDHGVTPPFAAGFCTLSSSS